MSLEDAMKLAVLVRDIPRESIKNGVIDNSMVSFGNAILGGQNASVMKPLPDKIRVLRDEIFTTSGPLSPLAQGDPVGLMQADGARVRILNGTSSPQLDIRTSYYLTELGIQPTEFGQTKAQGQTTIILYSPKLYAFRYLIDTLGITRSPQILIRPDPTQSVDIEIRLGSDWVGKLPAGY
jgi:hypothetical protein